LTSLGIVILLICILSVFALFLYLNPYCQFAKNVSWQIPLQTIANMVIAIAAVVTLIYSLHMYQNSQKLLIGQSTPLIDVSPISITQLQDTNKNYFAATRFSVVNYSGFKAFKIGIDLKYGEIAWIREWLKAQADKPSEKNTQIIMHKEYMLPPNIFIKELEFGKTTDKDYENKDIVIMGALNLENQVCTKNNEGLPVWVRVTWQNEQGHTFDEVHKYKLVCTKDKDEPDRIGYAFTFVPEGVSLKKDAK
jgi:hypothetical protein